MRYLPITETDREDMLARIGAADIDALFSDIPANKRLKKLIDLPLHQSELEVERKLSAMAAKNIAAGSSPFFCGAGAYKHHIPATVDHLIQRSEFLTSYTPYQPEIAQGTLQYLFEFQTQVALLTGMEVANASMYDGSTACAEAVLMAHRVTKKRKAVLSGTLHPHYRETVRTLSELANDNIIALPGPGGMEDVLKAIDMDTSCVVVQSPSFYGELIDLRPIAKKAQENGALLIVVVTEAFSLGLIESPGAMGADIVVGEGQSIGNGLNFGGPYVGLFACKEKYVRQMPGRLCGETVDSQGRRGYVLTLSTREQHIRREKATSNICTNSGLCVLAFTVHMTLLGEQGLRRTAKLCHLNACKLAESLSKLKGVEVLNKTFFNEFTLKLSKRADEVVEALAKKGILGGVPLSRLEPKRKDLENLLLVASTEINTDGDRAGFVSALKEVL
jgi:glycine dehydrogenase subunit 1